MTKSFLTFGPTSKYHPPFLTNACANFILAIPNLYHVVFRNDYREVLVYNNRLQVVKGPIALLENH